MNDLTIIVIKVCLSRTANYIPIFKYLVGEVIASFLPTIMINSRDQDFEK